MILNCHIQRLWLLMIYIILSSLVVSAQTKSDTITGKVHNIDEVTVNAARVTNKVASSAPTQLITKATIEKLAIQDMADAVRRFAGANVKDYGGIGGLKTVSVRNMGAAHTGISYDGITVSNCQASQIDIGRFSLDNVEVISLAVGQDNNMLQPARNYASAATLSIETERPTFTDNNSQFKIQTKVGSFGYITPSARWWYKISDKTRLSVNGNYMHADGNYPFTLRNGKYVTKEKRNNSAIDSYQGEINLYNTLSDKSNLDIKGYYFYSDRELPGVVTLYNPIANEKLWDENIFLQAKYRNNLSKKISLQIQGKYNYAWNRYQDKGNQYDGGSYRQNHRQNEYYLSASTLYKPIGSLFLSLAQDGYINTLNSDMPDCPYPRRYTSQSVFNVRFKQKAITADASILNTFITESVKVGEKPDDFNRLLPTLSLSFKPLRAEDLYFRLLYKSTLRTPNFNDLYYFQLGNRNLRPEKANEYNLGITYKRDFDSFITNLTLTIDGYYNKVTDKIVAFPTTYAWKMANYGKVDIKGMDITLSSSANISNDIHLILSGAYTWQKAIDLTNPSSKSYKDQLPYTPEHSGNGSIIIENPIADLGYTIIGVGKRYYMSQNIKENEISDYIEHSANISKLLRIGNYKMCLQAELLNITDRQYDIIKYYPMPGRSWRISCSMTF